ncbi:MAG: transposase [bacterium]
MANKKKQGKRYSEERVVKILTEIDQGHSLAETSRNYGISEQTIRNWRKRYRDMGVEEIRELKRLRAENAKLKKIVADQVLKIEDIEFLLTKKW